MLDNKYLIKFAELTTTTNAVENAKNVSGGKGAANMYLPIPKQEDTSKPVQVGLKKTLPTPTFKGILNPLPTTSSSLTKSAAFNPFATSLDPNSNGPTYLDAKRFFKDPKTLETRKQFAKYLNNIRIRNSSKAMPSNFLDNLVYDLYGGKDASFTKNPLRYSAAAVASVPTSIVSSTFRLGEQLPNRYDLMRLRQLVKKHPELSYVDTSFEGPIAALRSLEDVRQQVADKGKASDLIKDFHDKAYDKTNDAVLEGGLNFIGGKALSAGIKGIPKAKNVIGEKNVLKTLMNNKYQTAKTLGAMGFSLTTSYMSPEDYEAVLDINPPSVIKKNKSVKNSTNTTNTLTEQKTTVQPTSLSTSISSTKDQLKQMISDHPYLTYGGAALAGGAGLYGLYKLLSKNKKNKKKVKENIEE